jgi:hypothetical protein
MKRTKQYIVDRDWFHHKSKYCNDDPKEILENFTKFLEEISKYKSVKITEHRIFRQENYRYVWESDESYEERLVVHNKELEDKKRILDEKAKELGLKLKPVKDIELLRTKTRVNYPKLPNDVSFKQFCANILNFLNEVKDLDMHNRMNYICMHIEISLEYKRLETDMELKTRLYHEKRARNKAKKIKTETDLKIEELKCLARQLGSTLVKA